MKQIPKHIYIHIPFCKSICSYCDFKRFVTNNKDITKYINKIISQLNKYSKCKFDSIYVGGGTPNYLNNTLLNKLLNVLSKMTTNKTEFTIECNPEFITNEQCKIFKTNDVNRISLGVQTTNNKILKQYNRIHTIEDCSSAIKLLYKNKINNVSLDFIYGFNELTKKDINDSIKFLVNHKIKHVSFYSLEVKPGSLLNKKNYKINDDLIESQLKQIINLLAKNEYKRYEVSSWCIDKKYESIHNKSYWLTKDWIGIGLGSFGLENKVYYENIGTIDSWKKKTTKLTNDEYYLQVLMMGLRLVNGINISKEPYRTAYSTYKDKLKYVAVKNNMLYAKNINLLNESIIDCL